MSTFAPWLPLFPLNTVLFPGGVLPLKVFEPRYIDMVRDCMKQDAPFGVVLIRSGNEVGSAALPEEVGCIAHIARWDMETLGLLMLRTEGGMRFRILETRELPDHRLEARIDIIASDRSLPADATHLSCAQALKVVIDNVVNKGRAEKGHAFASPFRLPLQFDDASWVSNRWSEILPIPLKARQKLLELEDAQLRLTVIHQYLQQHGIL